LRLPSRFAPLVISPTPIRPHSPAFSSSFRNDTRPATTSRLDKNSLSYLGADEDCEDLGLEIFSILHGAPVSSSFSDSTHAANILKAGQDLLKPPSRNQNPVLSHPNFSSTTMKRDSDSFSSALSEALSGDNTPVRHGSNATSSDRQSLSNRCHRGSIDSNDSFFCMSP